MDNTFIPEARTVIEKSVPGDIAVVHDSKTCVACIRLKIKITSQVIGFPFRIAAAGLDIKSKTTRPGRIRKGQHANRSNDKNY
jgi:hypothetical protein